MGMRMAELEIVSYKVPEIFHATNTFLHNFSGYSGIKGTENWEEVWREVVTSVKDHEGFNCRWRAEGVDIVISYFDDPKVSLRQGNIVYATPEPQISFHEKPHTVSPAVRTYVGRTINEIAEDMQDVYHLRLERDPLRVVFPNEEYAVGVERYTVPILSS